MARPRPGARRDPAGEARGRDERPVARGRPGAVRVARVARARDHAV